MAKIVSFTGIVAAAIVLLAVSATAQTVQDQQLSCAQATSMGFDSNRISGTWYEVARNPAPPSLFCVEIDVVVSPQNSSLLLINTTYANNGDYLYVQQTVRGNISLVNATQDNTDGFNVTFTGIMYPSQVTYKLLDTNYDNYTLICGYTDATTNATDFGVVLTRNRNISSSNNTALNMYEQRGFNMSIAFLNGSMPTIQQSDQCLANAGNTALPFFSAMFALVYMMLQYLN